MKLFSLTNLALVVVAGYIANTVWIMYGIWNPQSCIGNGKGSCLMPYDPKHSGWHLRVYCSSLRRYATPKVEDMIWEIRNIDFSSQKSEKREVTLPAATKNNGSAFLHVFLQEKNDSPVVSLSTRVTQYQKALVYFKFMKNDEKGMNTTQHNEKPTTHWRPKVDIHVMYPFFNFGRRNIPAEIYKYIHETKSRRYYPILYIDELSFKQDNLQEIKSDMKSAPLHLSYSPISIGKLRLWNILTQSMDSMKEFGFTDEDTDQIKGIFTDTNIWFLALTFFVSTFHLLFEFLAFKHDLSYWRKRKTIEGLSLNTILYRCVSTIIIFLYLMDQQTSLIVLVPAGIGSVIEIWKVTKALKMTIVRNGWRFSVHFGTSTGSEKETEKFDGQAIKYLSYALYPLCIGCAVYSLFYVPHKSLYSWAIQSLVNGVYAFGFLFMLPQLFINYKLKSVAHLPWKAFMYKAFNTFIDDVFAFIIKMPTSHRVACFRDDVVFFCYLYQRWLYPIDKTRANEYGVAYEKDKED